MITPHIIRIPDISEEDLQALWVGTDSNVELRGSSRKSAYASPFENGEGEQKYPGIPDIPDQEVLEKEKKATEEKPTTPDAARVPPTVTAPVNPQGQEYPNQPPPTENPPASPPNGGGTTTSGAGTTGGVTTPGGSPAPFIPPNPPATNPPANNPPANNTGVQPATISFSPAYLTPKLREPFKVAVTITGGTGVGSVPFHLAYDPEFLDFTGAGGSSPFLSKDGTPVFVMATKGGSGREVIVGLSRQGSRPGVSGDGVLIELNFMPLKPGTTSLTFSDLAVLDTQAQPLPSERLPMTIVVQ
jgi:hypothetical protein